MYSCIINKDEPSEVVINNVQYVNETWSLQNGIGKLTITTIIQNEESHLGFLKKYETLLPSTYQVKDISIYKADNTLLYCTEDYDFPSSISIITESDDQGVFKGVIDFRQLKNHSTNNNTPTNNDNDDEV